MDLDVDLDMVLDLDAAWAATIYTICDSHHCPASRGHR